MLPDGEWRQYHATCSIGLEALEDSVTLGTVTGLKWLITGPGDGVDIYLDGVSIDYYTRNRDWAPGANLRIEELHTLPVNLNLKNAPAGGTVEIKMEKNSFPFGGKFGIDLLSEDVLNTLF